MTVSELAKRAGVGPQTIRYYEKRGLLPRPSRWGAGDYRDFDDDALSALRFIHAAKSAGFTLGETKQLLELRLPPRGSCAEVEVFFDRESEGSGAANQNPPPHAKHAEPHESCVPRSETKRHLPCPLGNGERANARFPPEV
jgi:DNA-binding transcriptional MerR regulator